MLKKISLTLAAVVIVAGVTPAFAEDGPGLVGWTDMQVIATGAGLSLPKATASIGASQRDAQIRCVAALNGDQPSDVANQCGLGR